MRILYSIFYHSLSFFLSFLIFSILRFCFHLVLFDTFLFIVNSDVYCVPVSFIFDIFYSHIFLQYLFIQYLFNLSNKIFHLLDYPFSFLNRIICSIHYSFLLTTSNFTFIHLNLPSFNFIFSFLFLSISY